jgi:hypothetical protein
VPNKVKKRLSAVLIHMTAATEVWAEKNNKDNSKTSFLSYFKYNKYFKMIKLKDA